MQSVPSRKQLNELIRDLKSGMDLEPEKLIVWLSEHGYNRLDQVEVPGDFAVRGGIIDIYLPGDHHIAGDQIGLTARIDFFGDQIESIKRFDLDTLGSLEKLETVRILDIKGVLPDVGDSVNLLSFLPDDAIVVLWAPLEIAEQAKSYLDRLPEIKGVYPLSAVLKLAQQFTLLELSQFDQSSTAMPSLVSAQKGSIHLPIQSVQRFETEIKKALVELAELSATHQITVFCENAGEQERFVELLEQHFTPGLKDKIQTPIGYIHRGFVWEDDAHSLRFVRWLGITSCFIDTSSAAASAKSSRRGRSIRFSISRRETTSSTSPMASPSSWGCIRSTRTGTAKSTSPFALPRTPRCTCRRRGSTSSRNTSAVSADIRSFRAWVRASGKSRKRRWPKRSWTWPPSCWISRPPAPRSPARRIRPTLTGSASSKRSFRMSRRKIN